jgi:nucleoid-associated protein YgaU
VTPAAATANKPGPTGLVDSTPARVKLEPETLAKPASGEMANAGAWPKKHVVAKGDSLGSLAKEYYQDAKKTSGILAANPSLKSRRRLKPGEIITIPQPVSETASRTGALDLGKMPSASTKSYSVQEGDTLYAIAKKSLGASERWREIFELNKDQLRGDPRRLKPGMALRLPSE